MLANIMKKESQLYLMNPTAAGHSIHERMVSDSTLSCLLANAAES